MRKLSKEVYFAWLYTAFQPKRGLGHKHLAEILHSIPFRWTVPNDDNRETDGKMLRWVCAEDIGEDDQSASYVNLEKEPASVLEVLIGLSIRMSDILEDQNQDSRSSIFLKELLGNLGLLEFTDDLYQSRWTKSGVLSIINTFLDRTYDFQGNGGLFPLKKAAKKKQNLVEIWYQMMTYMDENYAD